MEKNLKEIDSYPLIVFKIRNNKYKFAEAKILRDSRKIYYHLNEVELEKNEKKFFYKILKELKKTDKKEKLKDLDFNIFSKLIISKINKFYKDISKYEKIKLSYLLYKEYAGFGKIEPLIHDSNLSHILCEGLGKTVKVYHNNPKYEGVLETNIKFKSKNKFENLLENLKKKSRKIRKSPNYLGFMDKNKKIEILDVEEELNIESSLKLPCTPKNLMDMKVGSSRIFNYIKKLMDLEGSILIVGSNSHNRKIVINSIATMSKKNKIKSFEKKPGINLPGKNWNQKILPMYENQKKTLKKSLKRKPELIISSDILENLDIIINSAKENQCFISMDAFDLDNVMKKLQNIVPVPSIALIEAVIVLKDMQNGWPKINEIYEIHRYDKKSKKLKINPIFFNGKQIKRSKLLNK